VAGIQPKNDSEALILLWDRLFGNGIEGAIPGIQRDLESLKKGQEKNFDQIEAVDDRLTNYIHTREDTCPLLKRADKKGMSAARLAGIIFGAVSANMGLMTLVLKLAGKI
jgi:hypothetical protein